jgi:hypothetical protein
MKQRVETRHEGRATAWDRTDTEWPAQWPEGLHVRFPLPARPTKQAPVEPLPPTSARTVLTALAPGTSQTIPDLLQRTRLPARTLRHAVRWLEIQGKVERIGQLGDARRNLVRLRVPDFSAVRIADHFVGSVLC